MLQPQQADVALCKTYGFRTKAYHGSVHHSHITQWDRQRWIELLQEIDVLVMTPDVLLHTLSHGVFKVGSTSGMAPCGRAMAGGDQLGQLSCMWLVWALLACVYWVCLLIAQRDCTVRR